MITVQHRVADVREWFRELKARQEYVTDKTGCQMLEVCAATFIADEPTIFGKVNQDYVARELAWYESQSLNVNDIPGGPPKIWAACADKDGFINSNYGHAVFSEANCRQYEHVLAELKKNPESRRAVMIYQRPSMWTDYNENGRSDFICTMGTQHFIRNKSLVSLVQMRSQDLVFGYKNDHAWQRHVHNKLASDLSVEPGMIVWHAGSLHTYARHFDLIQ